MLLAGLGLMSPICLQEEGGLATRSINHYRSSVPHLGRSGQTLSSCRVVRDM